MFIDSSDALEIGNIMHHYVVTVDRANGVVKTYSNGAFSSETSSGISSNAKSNSNSIMIGSTNEVNSAFGPLNGKLDDVRIYDKALTEAEVKMIYLE